MAGFNVDVTPPVMVFQFVCRIVFIKIIFLTWFFECSENNTRPLECERTRNDGCCNGYYLNTTTDNCSKCMPGTTGPNCSIPCPYPSFGDECQGTCSCSNDTCDVARGCFIPTTDGFTSFPLTIEATTIGKNNTMTNYTFEKPVTVNSILIILIHLFGGVDILLICIYSIVFVIDRRRLNIAPQTYNRRQYVPENNSMYENVEIIVSPND